MERERERDGMEGRGIDADREDNVVVVVVVGVVDAEGPDSSGGSTGERQ